jgi:hypothetical protein
VKLFFEDHYPFDEPLAKKRFVVERFHAWMKSNRRLRIRYDYTLLSFKAFVYLSAKSSASDRSLRKRKPQERMAERRAKEISCVMSFETSS